MAVSRTMWLRGIMADAAKMKHNARNERDERTREITKRWNEGFKTLKQDNDRQQRSNEETYKREIKEINQMTQAQIAQGPPE